MSLETKPFELGQDCVLHMMRFQQGHDIPRADPNDTAKRLRSRGVSTTRFRGPSSTDLARQIAGLIG